MVFSFDEQRIVPSLWLKFRKCHPKMTFLLKKVLLRWDFHNFEHSDGTIFGSSKEKTLFRFQLDKIFWTILFPIRTQDDFKINNKREDLRLGQSDLHDFNTFLFRFIFNYNHPTYFLRIPNHPNNLFMCNMSTSWP